MAKRRARLNSSSESSLLLGDIRAAMNQAADDRRSNTITEQQFEAEMKRLRGAASSGLSKAGQGRVIVREGQARRMALRPAAGGQIVKRSESLPNIRIEPRDPNSPATLAQVRLRGNDRPNRSIDQRRARLSARLRDQLAGQTEGGILGQRPLTLQGELGKPQGMVGEALRVVDTARSPRQAARAAKGVAPAAVAQQATLNRRSGIGRGAIGAGIGALLLKGLLSGKKEQQIDPQIQMMLQQQMMQQQGGTSRKDLVDVGRLLSILKSLQGMAGAQGTAQPAGGLV